MNCTRAADVVETIGVETTEVARETIVDPNRGRIDLLV